MYTKLLEGVDYAAWNILPWHRTVDSGGVVGFIPALKREAFSLILRNGAENMRQKITPSPHGEDRSNGCVAQPSTYLFDRESGTFARREQVVS